MIIGRFGRTKIIMDFECKILSHDHIIESTYTLFLFILLAWVSQSDTTTIFLDHFTYTIEPDMEH